MQIARFALRNLWRDLKSGELSVLLLALTVAVLSLTAVGFFTSRISQGVRAFGMRRSRYIGLAKTGLQQACTGAAMNVSRAVSWLAGATRAKTRVTRFAALGQAA